MTVTVGKPIAPAFNYFDNNATAHPLSHFIVSADLGHPALIGGPYQVGTAGNGVVCGVMVPVPNGYQAALGGP